MFATITFRARRLGVKCLLYRAARRRCRRKRDPILADDRDRCLEVEMDWLTQNWIYLVMLAAVVLFMARRGVMGSAMGTHHGQPPQADERIDPVGGEQVPPGVSIVAAYQGRRYYFVSRENRERFEAAPHRYAPVPHAQHSRDGRHGHCE
jgi:YHS domain-containing protein